MGDTWTVRVTRGKVGATISRRILSANSRLLPAVFADGRRAGDGEHSELVHGLGHDEHARGRLLMQHDLSARGHNNNLDHNNNLGFLCSMS